MQCVTQCPKLSHGLTTYKTIWQKFSQRKVLKAALLKDFRIIDYQGIFQKGYGLLATKFKDYRLFASNYKLQVVLGHILEIAFYIKEYEKS